MPRRSDGPNRTVTQPVDEVGEHAAALNEMSNADLAEYLDRVGTDHRDSGRGFTCIDYRVAAYRLRLLDESIPTPDPVRQ